MDRPGIAGPGESGEAPLLRQARTAIEEGDITRAAKLLEDTEDHSAEWHFLMGAICYRRGWMDEAQRHYDAAARMGTGNPEYQGAADRMRGGPRYHPQGKPFGTLFAENFCIGMGAAFAFCQVCGTCAACGGGCYVCSRCIDGMPR